jgi:hypothetical protein
MSTIVVRREDSFDRAFSGYILVNQRVDGNVGQLFQIGMPSIRAFH